MPITFDIIPIMATIIVTVVSAVVATLKWLGSKMLLDFQEKLDKNDKKITDATKEISRVDSDIKKLIAELPLHYQRRDDAIREYTAVNAKLDKIWEALMEAKNGK